jgi:glycosyltransferase involved in cell wall biosynthesis
MGTMLSVVIPIFNEAENLEPLHARLAQVLDALPPDIGGGEIVYVDDGSADESARLMAAQAARDPRVRVISLSRNFGHQAAIMAGLAASRGDAVVIMDGDLQDPPEVIPAMVAEWRTGADVVRAERRSRADRGWRRAAFSGFHRIFAWISDLPMDGETGVFSLLDRRALDEMLKLPERHRFLPGLRTWIGFDQRRVPYDRQARAGGAPKQTLRRLVRYAGDAIFSFSYRPLRVMVTLGVVISVVGFALASVYVAKRLLGIETAQTGFTTLVTLVLFLGGIQLMALGLLGEYLGRIYEEVKNRPLYIVKEPSKLGGRRGHAGDATPR